MELTDTHCHLDFERFDEDRKEMIERAVDAGVTRMLIPGLDLKSSQSAIELAEKYEQVYAAVGVHPNNGKFWDERTLTQIKDLCSHPKVVAVGEIGLDYYWDETPREFQKEIFSAQLKIAMEVNLPVIIHNREATEDVLALLTNWYYEMNKVGSSLKEKPGVLHSYSGNIEQAERAIEMNFYLGITGPVTFKKADVLRSVVSMAPLDRLLIETDSPFLTPHPHRGKRNEPSYVHFVADKIAEVKSLMFDVVAETTSKNALVLFNW